MHGKKLAGFTLIELLLVIAVIAILIAILLPVLNRAKAESKTVVCTSNIKQLVVTFTAYEIQNGKFPYGFDSNSLQSKTAPPGGWSGKSDYDKQGWWWFNFITDFLHSDIKKNPLLWCPARSIRDQGAKKNILCGNYGVNQAICKNSVCNKGPQVTGTPLRTAQIAHPSATFLLSDSGYSTIMWWYAKPSGTLVGNPPHKISSGIMEDSSYVPGLDKANIKRLSLFRPGTDFDALNGRHLNKIVNTGFVDGHVIRKKSDDFYIPKSDENLSLLWKP
jgi:prepilin-type N-terminal cleavage/methylation domain-containing protein/prepilin-type processing-associated H-X9-DG protein